MNRYILLDEKEYKKDHPIYKNWDSEKCMSILNRPTLFIGKRWCYQIHNGQLVSIPPKLEKYLGRTIETMDRIFI